MNSITLQELFRKPDKFNIPSYQRAYAWVDKQREQFIKDLQETTCGYYLGHYLFEEDTTNKVKNVIDGQQRLTTVVIFMSCLHHELMSRTDVPDDVCLNELRMTYLTNMKGVQRFHTVNYDDPFFRKEIINRDAGTQEEKEHFLSKEALDSSSKQNIRDCRVYFDKKFREADTATLVHWFELVENAKVTYYEVSSKIEAAQIFAFQNDRGKSLSHLEVLKAFFMLQIYIRGGEEKEDFIQSLEEAYRNIYSTIVKIKTNEDNVLRYFWIAYRKGYNTENPLQEIKDYYVSRSIEKIIGFVDKLASAFRYVESVETSKDKTVININRQNNYAWALPVLIKGAVVANASKETMNYLAAVVENFTFRAMVRGGRADVQSRFNNLIKDANDDSSFRVNIVSFIDTIKREYWNDKQFRDALDNGYIYNRRAACSYLLWRYEETLQTKGYERDLYFIKKESLEHIAPQHPKDGVIATGYGAYQDTEHPEEGIESGEWLSSIGNMLLVSASHNSSLGNNNFKDKLSDYSKSNLMMQQKELVEQFKDVENPIWDKACIEARGKRIIDKAMEIWNLDKIMPPVDNALF